MNWGAEGVNLAGQIGLFIAMLILHRHGLSELIYPPFYRAQSSTVESGFLLFYYTIPWLTNIPDRGRTLTTALHRIAWWGR